MQKVPLNSLDGKEFMEVNDIISLINNVNSGKKICAGIGMQSHLSTNFPSVSYYKAALDAFA
jgi:endo-1,4-beta-xylanase